MVPLLLSSILLAATPQAAPAPSKTVPAPAQAPAPAVAKPLSFASQRTAFKWDQLIPLKMEVDGLKINSIFFNRKDVRVIKTVELAARAQIDVTNTASKSRSPGFAVAVFDKEDRLLGVASGGPMFGHISSGGTGTYDLEFSRVLERLPNGAYFVLSIELSN